MAIPFLLSCATMSNYSVGEPCRHFTRESYSTISADNFYFWCFTHTFDLFCLL